MVQVNEGKEANQNLPSLSSKIVIRSLSYILTMVVGGILYSRFVSRYEQTALNTIYITCLLIGMFLVLGSVFVLSRFLIRKLRAEKNPVKPNYHPFWFQILDTGFWIWLVFMLIIVSDKILA